MHPIRLILLLSAAAGLAWNATGQTQNLPRIVPTVADLLALDPALYAASTPAGTNYQAYVWTTGDTVPGEGYRLWRLALSSSAATNTVAAGGPLAVPYGAPTGRWIQVLDANEGGGGGEFPPLTANRAVITDGSGAPAASPVTATELGRLTGVPDNLTTLLSGKQATITGSATTIDTETLPAGRAVITDGSGGIAAATVTATEIGRLTGVSDNLTTLLAGKQATITGSATTIDSETLPAGRAVITDGSGGVAASSITATEIGRLTGVSDNLTTLLAGKQATITGAASTITSANLTAARVMVTDGSGKASVSSVAASALLDIGGTNAGPDLPWVSIVDYGATPDDGTADTAAFVAAMTNAAAGKKQLFVPPGRYLLDINTIQLPDDFDLKGTPRSVLAPVQYPTGNYDAQERVNHLLALGNNSRISGGLVIDGRSNDGTFTQAPANRFAMLKVRMKTNVVFEDLVFKGTYDRTVYLRESTNVVLARCQWNNAVEGYAFYNSGIITVDGDRHFNLMMTNSNGGAYCTVQACSYVKVNGSHFINLVSHTRTSTDFAAVYNEFGCINSTFENLTFDGISPSTTHSPIGFLLDGGVNNRLVGAKFRGYATQNAQGANVEGEADYWIDKCVFDGSHPTKGAVNNGSTAIYLTEWPIRTLDATELGERYQDSGHQLRGRGLSARGKITGCKIYGYHTGISGAFSETVISDNEIFATSFAAIRLLPALSYGYGFGAYPIQHRIWQNTIRDNKIFANLQHGIVLSGGDFTTITGNHFWDNNNTGSAFDVTTHWFNTGSTGTVTGQTNFVHGLSVAANAMIGMIAYWPDRNVSGVILTNTTTTFTLTGPTSATINAGDAFVINYGNVGRTILRGNFFYNTSDVWGVTNQSSLDPTQNISVAGTPFSFASAGMGMLTPGRQVELQGVLVGGGNLRAVIRNVSEGNPDIVWAVATSPTTGTFETATNGVTIHQGTGLMTWVDNPGGYNAPGRLTVTGNGTEFTREIDGNYFGQIGSAPWNQFTMTGRAINWDTNVYVVRPYTIGSNLVSQPWKYSKFSLVFPATTGPAIRWQQTGGTLDLGDNWVVNKNLGSSTFGPSVSVSAATNFLWTLRSTSGALNSANPKIAFGANNIEANTSQTVITNFNGSMDGMSPVRWVATSTNTWLSFTNANSSLSSSTVYTSDVQLLPGDAVEMFWTRNWPATTGRWNVQVFKK